ncbi:MAG: hypothetical protein ACJAW7_001103 [Candidatus Azotimanducaceae bacterium]|jgi:hypothetical protein
MSEQAPAFAVQDILDALALPEGCRVGQRVPKKLLLEQGAPTAADKRLVNDCVEGIQWLAVLKPSTIGVPSYRDDKCEYLEIPVVSLTLRGLAEKPASALRLSERLHRVVPYPLLLLVQNGDHVLVTMVHKRWAQNEVGKVVLDGGLVSASLPDAAAIGRSASNPSAHALAERAFVQSLSISQQSQGSLYGLYQGWIDCVQALQAARLSGRYRIPATPEQAAASRQALAVCERCEAEISRLQVQAVKEKQMARRVALNLTLKRVQDELAAARQQL